MPKVTYSVTPLVEFFIKGERDGNDNRSYNDGGLIQRMRAWMTMKQIVPVFTSKFHDGFVRIFLHQVDAIKLDLWLKEQKNVTKVVRL